MGQKYQAAAYDLLRRLRENVEQSDGNWPGADTVQEVTLWMADQDVDVEGPLPVDESELEATLPDGSPRVIRTRHDPANLHLNLGGGGH